MTNETIGPYRVLDRRMSGAVERLSCVAPNGDPVVLRRRGSASRGTGTAAEAVTLALGRHPHVAPVIDVLTDSSGAVVLVSPEAESESLRGWLDRRGRPEPGEVVTVVAPVLVALQHLARRGAAVRRVTLDDVEIDAQGAPVIVSAEVSAQGTVGADDAVATTTSAGVAFARAVGERAGVVPIGLMPVGSGLAPESGPGSVSEPASLDELIEQTFDLAEPVPLASVTLDERDEDHVVEPQASVSDEPLPAWTALLPESDIVDGLVRRARALGRDGPKAIVSSVRPRFWVLGAAITALVVAVISVPAIQGRPGASSTAAPTSLSPVDQTAAPGPTPTSGSSGADVARHDSSGTGQPETGHDVPARDAGPDADADADIDLVATTQRLIDARLLCLRDPTPACVSAVDQAGSSVSTRDAEVVEDPSLAAGESVPLVVTAELSRLGGSAILSASGPNGEPASILVMRTEAGWRLRDVTVGG